ncbi:MAG: electron transfer flavoprotein subunit alpha/FixB family protein [Syntrophobacteraceae bacterium]|nr:electron transfer flavoprotein subunit alpha/FixB family protein [Syntrophobacteraceae bacterium]
MNEMLLLVEVKDGIVDKKSLELMRGASALSKELGVAACAVVAGSDTAKPAEISASFGLDKVYRLDHPLLGGFQPDAWVSALEWLCRQVKPGVFLMSHSFVGKEVGPRLACRLKTNLTTDCLSLSVDPGDGLLVRTKPIYGGNAIAAVKCEGVPQMATIRKNAFEPMEEVQSQSAIIAMVPEIGEGAIRVKSLRTVEQEVVELDKANVVISGGRGIEEKEDFGMLEALAAAMSKTHGNVMIGCSRPVVDKCWMSSDRQVGLTGTIIAPDAYIAVGISGAIQHLVGMIRSKKIVAINTDPGCNIFKIADYGVVGDYRDIVPALVQKLEEQQ